MSTRALTRPRIAIAGMAIESSIYSAHRATYRDFKIATGADLIARYPFFHTHPELLETAQWLPVFYARSIPGGQVEPEVFEDFCQRIVSGIQRHHTEESLDGIFLDIHGAMSVKGRQDAEGELVARIREVVGPDVVIAASMDLHGNISPRFMELVDLPTCYRTAPHIDTWETRERAVRQLIRAITERPELVRSWVPVPILLAGEQTSTRVEPAASLYARIPELTQDPDIWDASIWIGYAWADEPRCHASVVVNGTNRNKTEQVARTLAQNLWDVREEFDFVGPPGTLEEGITAGLAATKTPYLVSDSGDNPGAGGSGDVTWTLHQLLADDRLTSDTAPLVYVASIFDEQALAELSTLKVGDAVDVTAGARVDSRVAGPVRITGTLQSFHEGDEHAGQIAVVARGGLRIVITQFRKAYHDVADFEHIGLDPAAAQIIVTKIGYLEPTLYDIAQGWTLALTPGPVDQDLARLGHHHIQRPMFPFDDVTGVSLQPVTYTRAGGEVS